MSHYGLCVDLARCIGCYSCVVGCKNSNMIKAGEDGRIRFKDEIRGEYPRLSRWIFPVMCMQCDHPPCISVCRFNASYKREDGIITIDPKKCVGCELCTFACPYGARHMLGDPHVADSCDFCTERIDSGQLPYCVESCPMDALVFGDLDDPESEVRKLIDLENAQPLKQNFRTNPKIFYANFEEHPYMGTKLFA